MVEFFAWLGTLDPILSVSIFIGSIVLAIGVVIYILRVIGDILKSPVKDDKKKRPLWMYLLPFLKPPEDTIVPIQEEDIEVNRTIDSQEIPNLILRIIRFKDNERSLHIDWMSRSMKQVELVMNGDFATSLQLLLKKADPAYYSKNIHILNLVIEAILDAVKNMYRKAITENHLERYTNPKLKNEYIQSKINVMLKKVSEDMCAVLRSINQTDGCVDFELPEEVIFSIRNSFEITLNKLIDFAIQREYEKVEITNKLISNIEEDEELSGSTIKLIKGVMNIEKTDLSR